jgi:hypothetical protein
VLGSGASWLGTKIRAAVIFSVTASTRATVWREKCSLHIERIALCAYGGTRC